MGLIVARQTKHTRYCDVLAKIEPRDITPVTAISLTTEIWDYRVSKEKWSGCYGAETITAGDGGCVGVARS